MRNEKEGGIRRVAVMGECGECNGSGHRPWSNYCEDCDRGKGELYESDEGIVVSIDTTGPEPKLLWDGTEVDMDYLQMELSQGTWLLFRLDNIEERTLHRPEDTTP